MPLLQMLAAETERLKRSQELAKLDPEQKAAKDRAAWALWLATYAKRLQHDAAAGASPQERAEVMNSTNPRWVRWLFRAFSVGWTCS
jgi:hypothetical protein